MRSCAAARIVVTRMPASFHIALTVLTARASVSGSGVTISLWPSKSSANAARAPLFSVPAIGAPAQTRERRTRYLRACAITSRLVLRRRSRSSSCEMRCNLGQHRRGLAQRHRQQHESASCTPAQDRSRFRR